MCSIDIKGYVIPDLDLRMYVDATHTMYQRLKNAMQSTFKNITVHFYLCAPKFTPFNLFLSCELIYVRRKRT